jgi:hypothetical protein
MSLVDILDGKTDSVVDNDAVEVVDDFSSFCDKHFWT